MAQTNYSFTNFTNATAKAYGKNLPISTKTAINVCNALRGLRVEKALAYLDDVAQLKRAIPFTRFTDGVGHRRGDMASGRFPVKAANHIRTTIASAVANAANHGLAEELTIISIIANKAASPLHQGRQRRRAMKRTHIEVVVQEVEEKSEKLKPSPKAKVAPKPKVEAKVEEKVAEKVEAQEQSEPEAKSNSEEKAKEEVKVVEKVEEPKAEEKPVVEEKTTEKVEVKEADAQ